VDGGRGFLIMQLTYTSSDETTIKVTLDEGETLDDLTGPTEAFVPVDFDNRHFEAIPADALIWPYVKPQV
jgi:hypothetical protein